MLALPVGAVISDERVELCLIIPLERYDCGHHRFAAVFKQAIAVTKTSLVVTVRMGYPLGIERFYRAHHILHFSAKGAGVAPNGAAHTAGESTGPLEAAQRVSNGRIHELLHACATKDVNGLAVDLDAMELELNDESKQAFIGDQEVGTARQEERFDSQILGHGNRLAQLCDVLCHDKVAGRPADLVAGVRCQWHMFLDLHRLIVAGREDCKNISTIVVWYSTAMHLFLYGQDGYRSFRKLQDLKARYIDASLGDTNLSQLDVARCSVDELTNTLLALPFLAKTRLVVLNRLLSGGSKTVQEAFLDLLSKLPDTTVAVIYEPGVPDRRTSLFKTLLKSAKVQEFTPLTGRVLQEWVEAELATFDVTIAPAAATKLTALTAGDTWRLATELRKLALATIGRGETVITPELVSQLVLDGQTADVFALGDALASNSPASALAALRQLINQGENMQHLVALVANTFRTLALVRDALDLGHTSPQAIARSTSLAPFVVSKHLATARRLTGFQITTLMSDLARLDLDSKRGRIDSEVGLELFVLKASV